MLSTIMKKVLYVAICLIMLSSMFSTNALANAPIGREAEEHILSQLSRSNIPNAAVAIIQHGETSYILKDSEYDTLFQIGSVSKSLTGFAILLLEEMGMLSVNDPVNQHLPWFEVSYGGEVVSHEDITIANLLHHTSGFTSNERRFPSSISLTESEFISQLIGVELEFYPSTAHVYGNANYIVLGFLIETVSGQSYDEFMTHQVLRPLGMYDTFTNAQNALETGRVIGGYRLGFLQARSWNPPVVPHIIPTGYIYSSIVDMTRWAGIHLGTVDVSEQFARVVQRSHENSYDFRSDFINPFAGEDVFYAAGWGVNLENGSIAHSGSTPGYLSTIRVLTHDQMAVVVLGNLNGGLGIGHSLGTLIVDTMEGEPFGRIHTDMFVFMDIAFIVLIIVGLVQIYMLVRLVLKAKKRLDNGEIVKARFSSKNIPWLIDPAISVVGLAAFYIGPSMFMDTSREFIVLFSPASLTWAGVAIWIMLVYSLCAFLVKVFVNPIEKKS